MLKLKSIPRTTTQLYKFSTFSTEEFDKAEKYVIETLRSRSWADYMLAGYLPKIIRTPYCAIQLFNL